MNSRKIYMLAMIVGCLAIQFVESNGSFLEWIWPNRDAGGFGSLQTRNLPNIKFEISETNDKFIEDSSKVLGRKISKSDFCQQRIFLSLKTSCNSLSDEELKKLSIELLNCQLSAESKPSHQCSENMSLEECTSGFTLEEWNYYNQIFSEAKQLCIVIRQDQFRAVTEITINKLAASTHQHLDLMERLQSSQKLLEKATLSSLDEITDSHLKLLEQQQEVLKMSEFQRHNAEANIREILKEKSLLKLGNKELSGFILNLKNKIQEGLSGIHSQNQETKKVFGTLLSDMEQLNIISSRIREKLDEIDDEISERGEENYALLETTKRQIGQVNEVVEEFFEVVMKFNDDFKSKLEWIENYLGKEHAVERLVLFIIHIGILLIGMLCLVFVGADVQSRYMLLGILAANMGMTFYKVYEMNVRILFTTICVLLLGNLIWEIKHIVLKAFKTFMSKIKSKFPSKTRILNRSERNTNNNINIDYSAQVDKRTDLNSTVEGRVVAMNSSRLLSQTQPYLESRMRHSSPIEGSQEETVDGQCKAITQKGTRCSYSAYARNEFCGVHLRSSMDRVR